jgi:hypothetical protein
MQIECGLTHISEQNSNIISTVGVSTIITSAMIISTVGVPTIIISAMIISTVGVSTIMISAMIISTIMIFTYYHSRHDTISQFLKDQNTNFENTNVTKISAGD